LDDEQMGKLVVTTLAAAALAGASSSFALAQQAATSLDTRWSAVLNSEVRYYSWSNSIGAKGWQVYTPIGIQFSGRPNEDWKLSFLTRTGTIDSHQSTPTTSSSGSGFTDTALSGTATYYGINGIQPYLSMNVNVPTGRSGAGTLQTAKNDSDIVATPIFGEGWNFGPSVGANFSINPSVIISASAGYISRGDFIEGRTATAGPRSLDPGNVTTMTIGAGYNGERLVLQTSLAYSWESTTYAAGTPLYQAGDRIIFNGKAGYSWTDNWSSRLSVGYSHFEKNKVAVNVPVNDFVRETANSNSDVYRVTFDTSYSQGIYSVGPTVTYLYRDRNGYNPINYMFIPAKTSWSAGIFGQVAANDRLNFTVRAEHIWVNEDVNPDKFVVPPGGIWPGTGTPAYTTNAWVVSGGGSLKF
jgi:hypothetical protein